MVSASVALLVAAFATAGAQPRPATAEGAACAPSVRADAAGPSWRAWGGDVRNTRFVPGGARALGAARIPALTLAWAVGLGPEVVNARSQPAVHAGTVFVATEGRQLLAIDLATGCRRWRHDAGVPLRSGVTVQPAMAGTPALVFVGDVAGTVHALDAATGALRWRTKVDPHPAAVITGTPQLDRGVLYVPVSSYEVALVLQKGYACCSFRGSVVALDAATGRERWKTYTIADSAVAGAPTRAGTPSRGPSGAAIWSSPTLDERRDRLYVGTGNNYSQPTTGTSDAIMALDRTTGRVLWTRQFTANDAYTLACEIPGRTDCPTTDAPDHDFGAPPMLVTLRDGSRLLIAGQKSGMVHALDPDADGAVRWSVRVAPGGRLGGVHWGMAADATTAYVAIGGQRVVPVRDSTVKEGFRLVPDAKAGGGLVALDLATGRERWRAAAPVCDGRARCSPAQSAPVTVIPGAVLSAALDGHLRAYDTRTGAVVWSVDTAREFPTVDGSRAHGGSVDVAGPVVAGSTVLVTSGYSLHFAMPGNALLAFRVPAR